MPFFRKYYLTIRAVTLLAIIVKHGVLISEWGGLYFALLEVSLSKIALWKNVCVDDWTDELAVIASNEVRGKTFSSMF